MRSYLCGKKENQCITIAVDIYFCSSASASSSLQKLFVFAFRLWRELTVKIYNNVKCYFHISLPTLSLDSETAWQHFRRGLSLPSLWPVSIFCTHTRWHFIHACDCGLFVYANNFALFLPSPSQGDRRRAFWRHCSQRVLQWGRCQVWSCFWRMHAHCCKHTS